MHQTVHGSSFYKVKMTELWEVMSVCLQPGKSIQTVEHIFLNSIWVTFTKSCQEIKILSHTNP